MAAPKCLTALVRKYDLLRNYESVKVARIFRSTDFITADGGLVWYQYTSLWHSAN